MWERLKILKIEFLHILIEFMKMKKPMKFIGFFVAYRINLNKFSVQIKFFSGSNFDISKLTDR